jgi:hypothetical protein
MGLLSIPDGYEHQARFLANSQDRNFEQRGLWCNHPKGNAKVMRETFNPRVSNLNVQLDREAYDEFKRDWPECMPVGLDKDSRHSPVYASMHDLMITEDI